MSGHGDSTRSVRVRGSDFNSAARPVFEFKGEIKQWARDAVSVQLPIQVQVTRAVTEYSKFEYIFKSFSKTDIQR